MANERYETQLFQDQLAAIRKKDRQAAGQIETIAKKVVSTPQLNDGGLKPPRAGEFKKKAADRKFRVIFRYCQWCLNVRKRRCLDCDGRSQNSVILLEVFARKDGYD